MHDSSINIKLSRLLTIGVERSNNQLVQVDKVALLWLVNATNTEKQPQADVPICVNLRFLKRQIVRWSTTYFYNEPNTDIG